jgi:hypothetical protein
LNRSGTEKFSASTNESGNTFARHSRQTA